MQLPYVNREMKREVCPGSLRQTEKRYGRLFLQARAESPSFRVWRNTSPAAKIYDYAGSSFRARTPQRPRTVRSSSSSSATQRNTTPNRSTTNTTSVTDIFQIHSKGRYPNMTGNCAHQESDRVFHMKPKQTHAAGDSITSASSAVRYIAAKLKKDVYQAEDIAWKSVKELENKLQLFGFSQHDVQIKESLQRETEQILGRWHRSSALAVEVVADLSKQINALEMDHYKSIIRLAEEDREMSKLNKEHENLCRRIFFSEKMLEKVEDVTLEGEAARYMYRGKEIFKGRPIGKAEKETDQVIGSALPAGGVNVVEEEDINVLSQAVRSGNSHSIDQYFRSLSGELVDSIGQSAKKACKGADGRKSFPGKCLEDTWTNGKGKSTFEEIKYFPAAMQLTLVSARDLPYGCSKVCAVLIDITTAEEVFRTSFQNTIGNAAFWSESLKKPLVFHNRHDALLVQILQEQEETIESSVGKEEILASAVLLVEDIQYGEKVFPLLDNFTDRQSFITLYSQPVAQDKTVTQKWLAGIDLVNSETQGVIV